MARFTSRAVGRPRGNDFAVYDPVADSWRVLPPLPTQRNHIDAAAIGGKIYVVGGSFDAGFESERRERLEVFNPASNTCSTAAALPRPRGGVNAVAAKGCLYVFGGEGNDEAPSGVFPDHEVYNPITDSWTRLAPMPVPVHRVTGAALPTASFTCRARRFTRRQQWQHGSTGVPSCHGVPLVEDATE